MYIVFLSIILIPILCTTSSNAHDECITPKECHVDETWFKEAGSKGFHIPIHSNCNNCGPKESWDWLSGRSTPKRICWSMFFMTKWGNTTIPFHCRYNAIEKSQCELKVPNDQDEPLNDRFKMGGEITITKTDNSTFAAGTICIFGKENIWFVLSTKDKLDNKLKKQVEKHFKAMGFKPDNIADKKVTIRSPVLLKTAKIDKCSEVEGGAGGAKAGGGGGEEEDEK